MKIKTILLVCVLVMATNSMVYANEEEGNEKIYYSENIVDSGITEELDNGEIDLYSVTSKIDWTIKPTIMKSGPEFLRKKGEKVKINVQVSPHKKVRVGITRTVTFVVKETGQYRFFVENKSDSTVRVVGMYSK